MKKIILAIAIVLCSASIASAQDAGKWAIAPKMSIYTNTAINDAVVGLGASGRYSITDNWRIEPAIAALLHNHCSIDVSCDAQYLFHINDSWAVYPSVGLTTNDIDKWAFGMNIGAGCDFRVANNWDLTAGLKWQPMFKDRHPNPVVIMIGGSYRF